MKKIYIFLSVLTPSVLTPSVLTASVLTTIACSLLAVGCAGFTATGGPASNSSSNVVSKSDNKKLIAINSLLVAPVEMDSTIAANVPSGVDINAMLSKALEEEVQIKVIHASVPAGQKKLPSQYLAEAKKQNLDGVLLTRLNNFDVRVGSEVGSTNPARVDFAMQILNSESQQVAWQSTYHFKDQALTDNLFKIKERLAENKPKFRSAEELLASGYRNSLKDFAQKRMAGFIR